MSSYPMQNDQPIQKLSLDVLVMVFEHVRSFGDLFNCTLCCKAWSTLAQKVLYRHVVLTDNNISKFFNIDSWITFRMRGIVQTLSLRIGCCLGHHKPVRHSNPDALQTLTRLPNIVTEMKNLRSVSLVTVAPTSFLVALLSSLPGSCTSLEIEGEEYADHPGYRPGYRTPHICPLIRRLLPQLQHLRVAWPVLCTELFEIEAATASSPPPASDLRTCVINCVSHHRNNTRLCDNDNGTGPSPRSQDALLPLLRTLSTELASGALGQAAEEVMVVSERGWGDVLPIKHHECLVRHDVKAGRSLAMPLEFLNRSGNETGWMMRVPDAEGAEWMVEHPTALFGIAEKRIWSEAAEPEGVRLPRGSMARYGLPELREGVMGRAEWTRGRTVREPLWERERECGMRLLDVAEGGLEEKPRVRELTPEGYRWDSGGDLVRTEVRGATEDRDHSGA